MDMEDREVCKAVEKEVREIDREVKNLTDNQKTILNLIKNDPHISIKEMSKGVIHAKYPGKII